jgi:hypothetical protein
MDSFEKCEVDPRALTSEGHLDTLGLCIFLVFIKRFNKNCPLVILDDIITSVDANHRERIAKLIMNEFKDFQLIITTHDFIWYKQLRMAQKINNCEHNFVNEKIIDWNIDTGPKLADFKPKWQKIKNALNEKGDKFCAGALSRIYLEWVLKKLCENFEISIKYKRDSKYTVSELFDPAKKRIKGLLNKRTDNPSFKDKIIKKFENLRSKRFMGNLLAHDNPEIDELSLKEVKDFCSSVNKFYKAFLCPKCMSFLKYKRNLNTIQCMNSNCIEPFVYNLKAPDNSVRLNINSLKIANILQIDPSPILGNIITFLKTKVKQEELENKEKILEEYIIENEKKLKMLNTQNF